MKSATRNRAVRLALEALEDRCVPAGNLNVFVSDGTLYIQGDRAQHAFSVHVHDEYLRVFCEDTTSINGVRPPDGYASLDIVGGAEVISAVVIDGNRGSDSISIADHLTASRAIDIAVRSGGGIDWVNLVDGSGLLSGAVNINTGDGNDFVKVWGDWSGVSLGVSLGSGTDSLAIIGSLGSITNLKGGAGTDYLTVPDWMYQSFAQQIAGFENIDRT